MPLYIIGALILFFILMLKMFKTKKYKFIFTTVLICSFFIYNVQAVDDAYSFDAYHVDITIHEDGLYHIEETVDVHYYKQKHGIYFQIASVYDMNFDNKNYHYNFPIKNVKLLEGKLHEIKYEDEGVTIIIGDKNRYANEFEHYKIAYDIQFHDLGLESGNDLIYYNIIGSHPTTIDNLSFTIKFPKTIEEKDLKFYLANFDENSNVSYTYDKNTNTLSGVVNYQLQPYESLTLYYNAGQDYFKFRSARGGLYIVTGLSILLLGFIFIIHNKHGKDDLVIQTVEFNPPYNFNSAECNYILGGSPENGALSLIFELAKKKYISIEETNKKRIIVTKLKESDQYLKPNEKKIYNGLFAKSNSVDLKNLGTKFYEFYLESINQTSKTFKSKEYKLFDTKNNYYIGLLFLALLALIFVYYFVNIILVNEDIVNVVFHVIAGAMGPLFIFIFSFIYQEKQKKILLVICFIIADIYLFIISLTGFVYYSEFDLLLINSIIFVISAMYIPFISKRSNFGTEVFGKVKGLKEFIKVTDEDRLKMMVEENPNLFYDVLPFAFAFGITDLWINHFKNIIIPPNESFVTNTTNYTYYRNLSNSVRSSARSSISKVTASSGGGSSSSSSGGGFSGGGFGGSSSGSW